MSTSNTRQNIQKTALLLFNQHGFRNVSVKEIAAAMDISPGNLTYHYPGKADLMADIFDEMFREMENLYRPSGLYGLHQVNQMFCDFFNFQEKYKFFFLDMVDLSREYKFVGERYQNIIHDRWAQSEAIVAYLVGRGLMEQEIHCGEYADLVKAIWSFSTFWPVQRVLTQTDETHMQALRILWQMLYPHLTESGRYEFEQEKLL